MATRRERIILELEDQLTPSLARAAVAALAAQRALDKLDGTRVDGPGRDIDALGRSTQRAGSDLNQFTGRLSALVDVAVLLGPALSPLSAVSVAGLAGMANQFGVAAIAGGVLVGSLQGVGDAVSAMEKVRVDPSESNIANLERAMADLSPQAREFSKAVFDFLPALRQVRDVGAGATMPGLTKALDSIEAGLPKVEGIFASFGEVIGDLAAKGADALMGDKYADFFAMLEQEGPKTLADLGHSIGSLVHGLTELWEAFTPLNNDFSSWMVGISKGFDSWATGLSKTQGFAEFVDYVRTNGPRLQELFASLVDMFLQVGEAAAPIGAVTVPALTAVAKAVAAIADSDMGTPLLLAATAMAAFRRASAGIGAITGSGGMFGTAVNRRIGETRTALQGAKADISSMAAVYGTAGARTARESARLSAASKSLGANLRTIGGNATRAAGPVAGLALATSGMADNMGLSNTASMALMGTMAGPWGAAIGGGVGMVMDLASANDDLAAATKSANHAMQAMDVSAMRGQLETLQATIKETTDSDIYGKDLPGWLGGDSAAGFVNVIAPLTNVKKLMGELSGETGKANDATADLEATFDALTRIGTSIDPNMFKDAIGRDMVPTLEQLQSVADRAAPALEHLGYSAESLSNMSADQLADVGTKVSDYLQYADSAAGRTDAFASSLSGLDSTATSTAEAASAMSSSLDALLSPALNAEAATDQWRSSLQGLTAELNAQAGFTGFSKQAIANREATRTYVEGVQQRLTAMAEAGAGEKRVATALAASRREFIKSGEAAGLSRKEITKRANAMGLTPKLIRTTFKNAGIDKAAQEVLQLRKGFQSLPKQWRVQIKQDGIPRTKAETKELEGSLGKLTKKQWRAVLELQNAAAKKGTNEIDSLLTKTTSKKREAKITADTSQATGAIERLNAMEVRDKSMTITTYQRTVKTGGGKADGGTVEGQRYPYGDKVLTMLAPGEEVISNRHGQADQFRADRAAGRIPAYADGGTVLPFPQRLAGGGTAGKKEKVKQGVDISTEAPMFNIPGLGWVNEDSKKYQDYLERQERLEEERIFNERGRRELEAKRNEQARKAEEERRKREEEAAQAALEAAKKAELDRLDLARKATNAQIEAANDSKRAAEEMRDATKVSMDRVGQLATAAFQSDLFQAPTDRGNLWTVGTRATSNPLDVLRQDVAGLRQRQDLISQLTNPSAGLSRDAIEELMKGSNEDIQALISGGDLQAFNALFLQRQALTSLTSSQIGNSLYAGQLAADNAAVAALTAQIDQLTAVIAGLDAQSEVVNNWTIQEAISAQATAREVARRISMAGAA